jgi:hypothetical protein
VESLTALERLLAFTGSRCDQHQFDEIKQLATPIRDALAAAHQEAPVVNLPLVIPLEPGDVGPFELSAYHVGITRHEVAAAALDRLMARDFACWDHCPPVAGHAKKAAIEAWTYANALFDVELATQEPQL